MQQSTNSRPKVAILLSTERRRQVLSEEAEAYLASFASVALPEGASLGAGEISELLNGAVACLTGWGTPPLSEALLVAHPSLKLIAHSAGSIRHLIPLRALESGIHVSHAAAIIADSVAEFVISQMLICLRELPELNRGMKEGLGWTELRGTYPGRLLGNQVVGIVGTGRVGRAIIHLLKAFGCRVLAYDPYLTTEQAASLGVESVTLDELLSGVDIVSLHAPVLPETEGMIGAAQLALLHDDAIFINCARASLVDEAALLQTLKSGRIRAILDVYSQEPLPDDSPFRRLPNVLITPHAAGHTLDTHLRQGRAMVDEIKRYLHGQPLQYSVTPALYEIMA